MATAAPLPLRRPVLADLLPGALARDAVLVAGLAAAIAVGARLAVPLPFTPVPVTAQTFVVLLGAAALGTRRAALGTGLYLGLGLAGTPWFAAGGATLGYVVGFVAAAAVVGRLAERGADRGPRGAAVAMVAGTLTVYACGVPWLALVAGLDLPAALALGVLPFLPGDTLKVVVATALLPTAWRLVGDRAA
jgi:biotin transport system substrate-specific component